MNSRTTVFAFAVTVAISMAMFCPPVTMVIFVISMFLEIITSGTAPFFLNVIALLAIMTGWLYWAMINDIPQSTKSRFGIK